MLAAAPLVEVRTLDVLLRTFFCCKAMLYLHAAFRYSLSWNMASAWYTNSWYFCAGENSSLEHKSVKGDKVKDSKNPSFYTHTPGKQQQQQSFPLLSQC